MEIEDLKTRNHLILQTENNFDNIKIKIKLENKELCVLKSPLLFTS